MYFFKASIYFYANRSFTCLYMHHVRAILVEASRGHWNWSYRQLSMGILEAEPGSSARTPSALNH